MDDRRDAFTTSWSSDAARVSQSGQLSQERPSELRLEPRPLLARLGRRGAVLDNPLPLLSQRLDTGHPRLPDLEKLHARHEAALEECLEGLRAFRQHGHGDLEPLDIGLRPRHCSLTLVDRQLGRLEFAPLLVPLVLEELPLKCQSRARGACSKPRRSRTAAGDRRPIRP